LGGERVDVHGAGGKPMIAAGWLLLGAVLGCSFGVVLMGLLVAARESDRHANLAGAGGQFRKENHS